MTVKELIRQLSCFDENLKVVIKDDNWPQCETKNLAIATYDGAYCVIETAEPETWEKT